MGRVVGNCDCEVLLAFVLIYALCPIQGPTTQLMRGREVGGGWGNAGILAGLHALPGRGFGLDAVAETRISMG